jgi:hypothetical protein
VREDFADTLRVEREASDGHVTMLAGPNHVTKRCDLTVGQTLHNGARQLGRSSSAQAPSARNQAW